MTTNEPMKPNVPYELIPTSLPGVFTFPAPPADFDPNTASPEELIKYGFPWPRPGENDPPTLRATWERVISRQRETTHIVPEFGPPIGRKHPPLEVTRVSGAILTGPTWGGCVVKGNWIGIIGTWTIPTVTPSGKPQGSDGGWKSMSWVGFNGAEPLGGSPDLFQAGVQQNAYANGNATYTSFVEWFVPNYAGPLKYVNHGLPISSFPVEPGHQISCLLMYVRPTGPQPYGSIHFANLTTGIHIPVGLLPPPGATFSGKTAEWIMEAPDGGIPTSSLPNFRDTPVVFTGAFCFSTFSCAAFGAFGPPYGHPSDPDPVGTTVNIEDPRDKTILTNVATIPGPGGSPYNPGICTINYVGP